MDVFGDVLTVVRENVDFLKIVLPSRRNIDLQGFEGIENVKKMLKNRVEIETKKQQTFFTRKSRILFKNAVKIQVKNH